jgi:hypothetical protein
LRPQIPTRLRLRARYVRQYRPPKEPVRRLCGAHSRMTGKPCEAPGNGRGGSMQDAWRQIHGTEVGRGKISRVVREALVAARIKYARHLLKGKATGCGACAERSFASSAAASGTEDGVPVGTIELWRLMRAHKASSSAIGGMFRLKFLTARTAFQSTLSAFCKAASPSAFHSGHQNPPGRHPYRQKTCTDSPIGCSLLARSLPSPDRRMPIGQR